MPLYLACYIIIINPVKKARFLLTFLLAYQTCKSNVLNTNRCSCKRLACVAKEHKGQDFLKIMILFMQCFKIYRTDHLHTFFRATFTCIIKSQHYRFVTVIMLKENVLSNRAPNTICTYVANPLIWTVGC